MSSTAPEKPPASAPAAAASPSQDAASNGAAVTDTTLIRLLAADIERLKAVNDAQRDDQEHKGRDEARLAIMLRLAQDQIEHSKEQIASLRGRMQLAEDRREELEHVSERQQSRILELEDQIRSQVAIAGRVAREHTARLHEAAAQKSILEDALTALRKDLDDLSIKYQQLNSRREAGERMGHETKVKLEVRCTSLQEEVSFLTDTREREAKTALERECAQSKAIAQLKTERDDALRSRDAEHRRFVEELSNTHAALTTMQLKYAQQEMQIKEGDRDSFAKVSRLTQELHVAKERAEKDFLAAKAIEQDLRKETARLVADLRVAQSEINQLSDKETEGTKSRITALIELESQKDVMTKRIAALEAAAEKQRAESAAKEVDLSTQVDLLQQQVAAKNRERIAEVARVKDDLLRARAEATTTATRLDAAEQRCASVQSSADAAAQQHVKEIAALRAESDGYRASVEKLEQHMRDNYVTKILQDEVDSLRSQNGRIKQQLTAANSSLANLRIEADIAEQYREKLLQDQVGQLQSKVSQYERERRFSRPLLRDLLTGLLRHPPLDAALEKDLELFVRNFGEL